MTNQGEKMDKLPSSFSAVKIKRCAQNPKRKEPFPEITKCSMPGSDDADQRKKRKIKKSHYHYQTRSRFRLSRSSSHNNENPLIHMRRKDKTKLTEHWQLRTITLLKQQRSSTILFSRLISTFFARFPYSKRRSCLFTNEELPSPLSRFLFPA